jgi:hypothetical protein
MSWHYSDQWAAGFFDGEGCVSIVERQRTAGFVEHFLSVQIGQNDKRPLIAIQNIYGGALDSTIRPNGKTFWRLRLHGTKAMAFLHAIEPYCLVKRPEITVALMLREAIGKPGHRSTPENRALKAKAFQLFRGLRCGQ